MEKTGRLYSVTGAWKVRCEFSLKFLGLWGTMRVYLTPCCAVLSCSVVSLCNPMDCSSPGSSVQSRILISGLPLPSPGDLDPGMESVSPAILYHWATWENYTILRERNKDGLYDLENYLESDKERKEKQVRRKIYTLALKGRTIQKRSSWLR